MGRVLVLEVLDDRTQNWPFWHPVPAGRAVQREQAQAPPFRQVLALAGTDVAIVIGFWPAGWRGTIGGCMLFLAGAYDRGRGQVVADRRLVDLDGYGQVTVVSIGPGPGAGAAVPARLAEAPGLSWDRRPAPHGCQLPPARCRRPRARSAG